MSTRDRRDGLSGARVIFGLPTWTRSVRSFPLLQTWGGQACSLDIREVGHRDVQLLSDLEEDLKARIPFAPFDLLEIPQGYRGDLFLGSAGNVPCSTDVFADEFAKGGEVHALSFPVDQTVNPTTTMGSIMVLKTRALLNLTVAILLVGAFKGQGKPRPVPAAVPVPKVQVARTCGRFGFANTFGKHTEKDEKVALTLFAMACECGARPAASTRSV